MTGQQLTEAVKLKEAVEKVTSSLREMKTAFESFARVANTAGAEQANKADALEEAKSHASNYAEYNKLLRSWFVAFGIGGIALFYTKPELVSGMPTWAEWSIIGAFLLGSAGQIFVAFINKVISWRLHEAEHWRAIGESRFSLTHETDETGKTAEQVQKLRNQPKTRRTRLEKLEKRWKPVSEMFSIDFVCDCLSLLCFAYVVTMILISAVIWAPSTALSFF